MNEVVCPKCGRKTKIPAGTIYFVCFCGKMIDDDCFKMACKVERTISQGGNIVKVI